jgi:choline dehydrogenase-like flavoprotein
MANPMFTTGLSGNPTPSSYRAQFIHEPRPNPGSRVIQGHDANRLGMRRIHIEWKVAKQDFDYRDRIVALLSRTLGMAGAARLQHVELNQRPSDAALGPGLPHLGVTRMSQLPSEGVVDRNCRIHGFDNIFIWSSSVFPAGGFSNPTRTIVALAVRLARRLSRLRKG